MRPRLGRPIKMHAMVRLLKHTFLQWKTTGKKIFIKSFYIDQIIDPYY